MEWLYQGGQQIFVGSYLWVFFFYKQARLSGVSAVSFAISECEWGVYFQGCHGNHCICGDSDWGCRPSKILLFLSWVNTWHTCVHAPVLVRACARTRKHICFFVFFCMNTDENRHRCWLVSRIWCSSHIKQYTDVCMFHPFFQCCQTSRNIFTMTTVVIAVH